MKENEYNETFDMSLERQHQDTMKLIKQYQLIGEQICKMPATPSRVLEVELRHLAELVDLQQVRINELESEVRRLEMLATRV